MQVKQFSSVIKLELVQGTDTQTVQFELNGPLNCDYADLGEKIGAKLQKGLYIAAGRSDLEDQVEALSTELVKLKEESQAQVDTIHDLRNPGARRTPDAPPPALLADDEPAKKKRVSKRKPKAD